MHGPVNTNGSRYVPELDGLRGIAIILVLIHHQLTPFSLSAGFLGVDLFFVLSGFLITQILLSEFEKSGSISLRNFYMRRVLRLGPGLFLYLIACLVITYNLQLIYLAQEIKLIAISLLYSTNWIIAFGLNSPFDPTAITWSLSIEEQFYLVWPVLFFGCLVLRIRRRYIIVTLAIIIFAILIHRGLLWSAGSDLRRLYYGTDTRADALLMGCLLALLPLTTLSAKTKRWLNIAALLCVAILACLISASSFTDPFLYRGGFTLVALCAGVIILVAAYFPSEILTRTLRIRPLRWLGKISYGLYLWHWMVVLNSSFYYLGFWEPWAKIILAMGIASASYYFVERPFNKLKTRFSVQPQVSLYSTSPILRGETSSPIPIPFPN
ncbi:MAG: acyltransferase family protein [Pyrinomonadaceae bacterium]